MNQTAEKCFGVSVHDVLLPGRESDRTFMLSAGAVLREEARPVLRIRRHKHDALSLAEVDTVARQDELDCRFALSDNRWIRVAARDHEAIHAAGMRGDVAVTQVLT
ncbi:MAG: hypothetical protein JOZ68_15905 [Acidimicrobiia bacterium]|nr:hypothetical protein [Acidimicrobiia bacterium]